MKHIFIVIILVALFSSCSMNQNLVKVTGTIEELQMSTFQYGTHTIKTNDAFYALKSDSVMLNDYNNKKVTLVGKRVEGFPLSGGPVLLEVTEVKE